MVIEWIAWIILLGFGGVLISAFISTIISNRQAQFPSRYLLFLYGSLFISTMYTCIKYIPS